MAGYLYQEKAEEFGVKDKNAYKVLIIDDENDLCFLLQTICRQRGLKTQIANNLEKATTELRENPDIIFLDNNLPDGFGLEFIHTIREHTKDSFVVMMTAQSSDSFQKEVFQSGINYFLVKPFDISSVINLIDKSNR